MKTMKDILTGLEKIGQEEVKLKAEQATLEAQGAVLVTDKLALVRQWPVHCVYCNKTTALHRWTFVQYRYYVPSRGCIEGDYWENAEAQCCHIKCPNCSKQSYIHLHRQRDRITAIIREFGREKPFDTEMVIEAAPQR